MINSSPNLGKDSYEGAVVLSSFILVGTYDLSYDLFSSPEPKAHG